MEGCRKPKRRRSVFVRLLKQKKDQKRAWNVQPTPLCRSLIMFAILVSIALILKLCMMFFIVVV